MLTVRCASRYGLRVKLRSSLWCIVTTAGCYAGPGDANELEGSSGVGSTSAGVSAAATQDVPDATATSSDEPTTGPDPTAASQASGSEAGATDMSAGPGADSTGEPVDAETTSDAGSTSEPMTSDPVTSDPSGDPPPSETELLCARWTGDRADLSEGTWDGAVNGCQKGALGGAGRANTLRLINLYRWIAGLPEVAEDGGRSDKAQACALMMDANGQLSHTPPNDWKCYSADGADAAGKSNIAGSPGVLGVDLYMVDYGNDTTMGHRRWLLSNSLGPVGIGSTAEMSCLYVIGGGGDAGAPWSAWPPPGLVPYAAIHVPTVPWSDVDQAGWTVQSDSINVKNASVTVTEGGVNKPVKVNALGDLFGSQYAVRFVPQGWAVEVGKTYDVALSVGDIAYSVTVVDCG